MFRRLVSNLAFSPSLVEQLGIYARRLRKEESIRRLGLILTVFAIIVQVFIIISPPESTNTVFHDHPMTYSGALSSNISAINNTQNNVDATTITAREHDVITFSLTITNNSVEESMDAVSSQLGDILEYADIINYGGGEFNKKTKVLTWVDIALGPGASTLRNFTVSIKSPVPSIAQNGHSYDCVIANKMNNQINIKVNCPPHKIVVEQTILNNLSRIDIVVSITFWTVVIIIILFLWLRSRQLGKEVRSIRKRFNSGTL